MTGTLNRGGIESWLINLLAQLDRKEIATDIMTLAARPQAGSYDERARQLGARVIDGPPTGNPLTFALGFWRMLRRFGPYDVVHSHVHHFGGLALLLARLAGVPLRFSTSHNDTHLEDKQASGGRYAYLTLMRAAMQASAPHRLAVSPEAAAALFGPDWAALPTRIRPLGIDLQAYRQPVDKAALRTELRLPPGEPMLGHVGQFRSQKNHAFLLDIFAAFVKRYGPAQLLLIGDGDLRSELENQAHRLGVAERVHFLGSRPDVAALLIGAVDVFVFPSHHEGLSLALLEAQAAGLPCVVSTGLSLASQLDGSHYTALALSAGADVWAEAVQAALAAGRAYPSSDAHDIASTAPGLRRLYLDAAGRRAP